MMSVKSKTLSTFTEIPAEPALPPYSSNEEDTQETESEGDHHEKGALCRVQNLGGKVSRRGMKKLMAIMPSKVSVDTIWHKVSLLSVCAHTLKWKLCRQEGQNFKNLFAYIFYKTKLYQTRASLTQVLWIDERLVKTTWIVLVLLKPGPLTFE